MEDIKSNLHRRISDENEMTWSEYIILGNAILNDIISANFIEHVMFEATNEELNDMVEELDWLLSK